jgi:glutamyl-tRNA reductase
MKLLLLGISHHTAPVGLRERMSVDDPQPHLAKLCGGDEIDEAVLVSTCNRTEVVVLTRNLEAARMRLRSFFRRDLDELGPSEQELDAHFYEHRDSEAMRHVLRVASALDSMVVGEPQILGQTKDAYREAVECGASGPILDRLFQRAFATAKRVRSETKIASHPVSVARIAANLAGQIFEDLTDKRALMVGAGEMIEHALSALGDAGLRDVSVANRTAERAANLAVEYGGTAHGLDELPTLLGGADVVLTCIGADRPIVTSDLMKKVVRARRGRPVFVIDIGVPRNVDPAVDALDAVFRYDIDDLSAVADENSDERRREQVQAEAIVAQEQQNFDGWFAALRAVPTIKHLRGHVESLRSVELDKAVARLDLSDEQRHAFEAFSKSLVNKILHGPTARLRAEAEREEGMAYLEVARMLFGLDDETRDEGEEDAS